VVSLLRLVLALFALAALTAGTVVALTPAVRELPSAETAVIPDLDLDALDDYAVRSYVYDSEGGLIDTLKGPENRQPVSLAYVPKNVQDAILAVEDADFYRHGGFNLRSTTRALLENVSEGGVVQGGSTITQQLVKNALLTSDQDLDRKTAEATLALRLERELTKEEILETYLNTIYFGSGAYGVQAAAETYWGVDVSALGWAEAAMLAALISNPTAYDPTLRPDEAKRQRAIALERMARLDLITAEEARDFARAPLPKRRCTIDPVTLEETCGLGVIAPPPRDYFLEDVKQMLLDDPRYNIGATNEEREQAVFGGGLKIYTTLDPAAQFAAQAAVTRVLPPNDRGVTAATVSVENATGAVRAMVGGPGFETYKYNIATNEFGRPTGSTFKTFVLLTALEQGGVPNDTIGGGGEFRNPGGTPNPYEITGRGGTLQSITQSSSNGAFVRLGQTVGMDDVYDVAGRLGLSSPPPGEVDAWDPGFISAPLGVTRQTPVEMASAYSAIANGGVRQPWYLIERVEDAAGNVLFQHQALGTRAVSKQSACLATQILTGAVTSGTGTRARLNRQPAAGKTGTTGTEKETYDTWFTGFTPYLTTAVWIGNPESSVDIARFNGVANFGGVYPARIWQTFNEAYHTNRPVVPFPKCDTTRSGREIRGPNKPNVVGGTSSSGSSGSTRRSPTTSTTTPGGTGGGTGGTTGTTTTSPATSTPAPPPTSPPAPEPPEPPPAPTPED